MNFYALSGLINGLTATALGVFVYSRAPGDLRHRTYSLFCSGVAVWSYFYCAWHLTESRDLALLFVRLLMIGAILLPVFYLHHVLALLDAIPQHRRLLQVGYLASVFFILSDLTNWFVAEVRTEIPFPNWPKPGPVFHVYLAAFLAYAGYSIYLLAQAYRNGTGLRRNQYLYLLAATVIGYAGGATNFPLWYGIQIPPDGTILVTVYTFMVAHAIVQYRLMDITVVMHKGLARGVLLAAIMVPVYLAVTVSQRATVHSIPPLVAGALVLASGLWIAFKNPRSIINLTFGLVCVGVFTWLFSFFMIYSTPNEAKALFWGKMIYAGVVYIPAFFYHFCLSLVESQARTKLILANYAISTAFLLLLPTTLLINGQYSYFWGYYPKAGVAHP
ncbi:MAG: histidine kinase N-terminal 7TM domain-containing protein, partial [Nitrospiraceae bacterium]